MALIHCCNKNEFAPQMIDQEFSVEENSPAGTIFGVVEAHDRDECQLLIFEIIDGATQPYQDFPDIDISSLIQDYTSDPENSYGIFLKLVSEDPYKILLLASSDNQNESIRPKLDVYYTIID